MIYRYLMSVSSCFSITYRVHIYKVSSPLYTVLNSIKTVFGVNFIILTRLSVACLIIEVITVEVKTREIQKSLT